MDLVKAKCTQCGGELDVNPEAECLICKYCGTPFIVAKAINNYKTTINNTTVNNITADTIIMNGPNVDSLVARGSQITNAKGGVSTPEQAKTLRDIANKILEQESQNFYGHWFLFRSGEASGNELEMCFEMASSEQKSMVNTFVTEELKSMLELCFTTDHLCTRFANKLLEKNEFYAYQTHIVKQLESNALIDGFEELSSFIKKNIGKYGESLNKMVQSFTFTESGINGINQFEYKQITDGLYITIQFMNSLNEMIDCKDLFNPYAKKVKERILCNRNVIEKADPFGAKTIITNVYTLCGEKPDESVMNTIGTKTLTDFYVSRKSASARLGPVDVCFTICDFGTIRFKTKDVIVANSSVWINPNNLQATLWWDIAYRVSDTEFSIIRFGQDTYSSGVDVIERPFSKDVIEWAISNKIQHENVQFTEALPFQNGLSGLRYRETMPARKGGCYVATCVYGSYDCPEVWVLRRFRDYKLNKTWAGRLFIKLYYAVSPTLVKWFGDTKWFKAMWKGKLNRMVEKYKEQGFEDTPYDDLY